jgi:phenylalanyl-tRNA synthetase beta chain
MIKKSKFEVSDYQKSERDFAFIVDKNFVSQNLVDVIYSVDKNLIKEVKIFDIYHGENIPEDKKSIAINVTIQSNEKTLKRARFRFIK